MPNVNAPAGLIPRMHAKGGGHRLAPVAYQIASALASNIAKGSSVIPVGTNRRIDIAAAGSRLLGVFQGCSYVDANGAQFRSIWVSGTTLASGTICEALVYDDPDILFGVQVSSATGLVAGDIGAIADLTVGGVNTITGNSADQLDQTTLTSTQATGGNLFVDCLDPIQGNDYGQYAKALVRINEHVKMGSTVTGQSVSAY